MSLMTRILAVACLALSGLAAGCGATHDKPSWLDAKQKSDAAASYYVEQEHDGRLYVFGTEAGYASFQKTQEMPLRYTLIRGGPKGETVFLEVDAKSDTLKARLLREFRKRHPESSRS